MSIRTPKNPELKQAVLSLGEAAQHVRNAVQGKIDAAREAAVAELAQTRAKALQKTGIAQDRLDAVLKKAEARLHKVVAKAQKSIDKAVRKAEELSAAVVVPARTLAVAAAPVRARKAAAKKGALWPSAPAAPAKKAAVKRAPSRKAVDAGSAKTAKPAKSAKSARAA